MESSVMFSNFSVSHDTEKLYNQSFNQLKDLCPSQSYLHATVTQVGPLFKGDFSIYHPHGQMAIQCEESTMSGLMKIAFEKLQDQIQLWRKQRDVEPFQLNRHTEMESFNAYESCSHLQSDKYKSVLIVEDDPSSAALLESLFQHAGCKTYWISDARHAVEQISTKNFDLVVLDWCLPYHNGSEVLKMTENIWMKNGVKKRTPVIICSSLKRENLKFSNTSQFVLLDHWDKCLPFTSLLNQVNEVLNQHVN